MPIEGIYHSDPEKTEICYFIDMIYLCIFLAIAFDYNTMTYG